MKIPFLSNYLQSRRAKSMTLVELFETRYRAQRLGDAAATTIKGYNIVFRFLEQHLGRPATIRDLNNATAAKFQEWRLKNVTRATVKHEMDCVRAMWRWCFDHRLTDEPIDMRALRIQYRTPRALTWEELNRVWEAIKAEQQPVIITYSPRTEVPGALWWGAMFLTCWDTGERLNPIFELLEGNLDLEGRSVRFPAEDRKGRTADSVKELHPDTCAAIERLLALYTRRTYRTKVFRWAIQRGSIWPAFGRIMERAGLPNSKDFKFHCLRKSFASHLAAAGGNVSEALGHSNGALAKKHYIDPRIAKPGPVLELLHRPGDAAPIEANGQDATGDNIPAFGSGRQPPSVVAARRAAILALLEQEPQLMPRELGDRLGISPDQVSQDLRRLGIKRPRARRDGALPKRQPQDAF